MRIVNKAVEGQALQRKDLIAGDVYRDANDPTDTDLYMALDESDDMVNLTYGTVFPGTPYEWLPVDVSLVVED